MTDDLEPRHNRATRHWLQRLVELSRCAAGVGIDEIEAAGFDLVVYLVHGSRPGWSIAVQPNTLGLRLTINLKVKVMHIKKHRRTPS